jgi:hypothetical protein
MISSCLTLWPFHPPPPANPVPLNPLSPCNAPTPTTPASHRACIRWCIVFQFISDYNLATRVSQSHMAAYRVATKFSFFASQHDQSWLLKHGSGNSVKFRAKTFAANSVIQNTVDILWWTGKCPIPHRENTASGKWHKTSFVKALATNCTGRQNRLYPHVQIRSHTHTRLYGQQLDVAKCNLLISRPLQGGRGSMVERECWVSADVKSAGYVLYWQTLICHRSYIIGQCCGWIPDPDPSI